MYCPAEARNVLYYGKAQFVSGLIGQEKKFVVLRLLDSFGQCLYYICRNNYFVCHVVVKISAKVRI